jgi:hypothetical protein
VPATSPRDPFERLESGRQAFNGGQFFAAHEHWEEAWHQLTGPERRAVQGLIQIAAGLHHLTSGRPRPAAAQLGKGLAKLALPVPEALSLWNLGAVVAEVARLRDGLVAGAAANDTATATATTASSELRLSAL